MHNHRYYTISDSNQAKVEICNECKKKLITKKDPKTGRIDNKKYLKEHIVDTSQPFGKTGKIFAKAYGEEAGYISKVKG